MSLSSLTPLKKQEKMDSFDTMQYEMIDEKLITTLQRDAFVEKLDELATGVYSKKGIASLDNLSANMQDMIVTFLQKNKIDTKKNSDVLRAFTTLKSHVQALPTLTLELAFEPSVSQLAKFAGKIELYGVRPLLQTKINTQILAGAILEMKGKHIDCSINNTNV